MQESMIQTDTVFAVRLQGARARIAGGKDTHVRGMKHDERKMGVQRDRDSLNRRR